MIGYAILFGIGALLGTALDHLHVASGATSYAAPAFFQQAAWVPLLFGFAAAGFANLHRNLRALWRGPPARQLLALDFGVFVAAYAASAYLPIGNLAMLLLFVAVFAARFLLARDPPHRLVHALACAALGVFSEWLLTGFGLFIHHRADVLRVPLWLPGLYMLASPLLAGLDDLLAKKLGTPHRFSSDTT